MVKKLSVAWPAAVVCPAAITQECWWLVQIRRTPSSGLEKPAALPVLYFVGRGSERLANLRRDLYFLLSRVERGALV